jgi:hypothetical protein
MSSKTRSSLAIYAMCFSDSKPQTHLRRQSQIPFTLPNHKHPNPELINYQLKSSVWAHFQAEEPQKFANALMVYGASNVNKMLHVNNWAAQ